MAVERAVAYGVDVIQIREKDLAARPLMEITRNAVRVARGTGTKIVVNDRLDVALASGAAGVHLPADGFSIGAIRRIAPAPFLVGVSTHSLGEARRAAAEGADFIVFGPVFRTTSKPGARGVGVHALAEVVREANLPVYALGGMTPERVGSVARAGAAGVAGISVFLEEDSLRRLMEAIDQTGSE
jgi:thiamine-phosphate pyrophosphorylase